MTTPAEQDQVRFDLGILLGEESRVKKNEVVAEAEVQLDEVSQEHLGADQT